LHFAEIPLVPEASQSAGTTHTKLREKKKKPKSFQESIQDMQEQNRVLMEQKFSLQKTHQEQRYALETRRQDLEIRRFEQQQQDAHEERELRIQESRVRELTLQLEIEKLRNK